MLVGSMVVLEEELRLAEKKVRSSLQPDHPSIWVFHSLQCTPGRNYKSSGGELPYGSLLCFILQWQQTVLPSFHPLPFPLSYTEGLS